MKVQATGKQVGARQAFERKLGAIGPSPDGTHLGSNTRITDGLPGYVNHMHNTALFAGACCNTGRAVQAWLYRRPYSAFILSASCSSVFLRFSKRARLVIANDVVHRCLLHRTLHARQMIEAFIALGMLRGLKGRRSMDMKRLATRKELIILSLAETGMNIAPPGKVSRAEAALKFSYSNSPTSPTVHRICPLATQSVPHQTCVLPSLSPRRG